jgi:hypothetical protein
MISAVQALTILTDSAAQVDRARPADARNGPAWDGPGETWWETFAETVEAQIQVQEEAATRALPDIGGQVANRYQLSQSSLHSGHDPSDPRVSMIEEMAIDSCASCAEGQLRWRDRQSGEFVHPDDFGYEADSCKAHNLLRIAVDHGVPIYTGADLEFPEDDDA